MRLATCVQRIPFTFLFAVSLSGCLTKVAHNTLIDGREQPMIVGQVRRDDERIYAEWRCDRSAGLNQSNHASDCVEFASVPLRKLFPKQGDSYDAGSSRSAGCIPSDVLTHTTDVPTKSPYRPDATSVACISAAAGGVPRQDVVISNCAEGSAAGTIRAPDSKCWPSGSWKSRTLFYVLAPVAVAFDIATSPIQAIVLWTLGREFRM